MFKRQQNESTYGKSVTVTERVCTKRTFAGELLVMICHSVLHENPKVGYLPMLCDRRTDGRVLSARNTFVIWIKI